MGTRFHREIARRLARLSRQAPLLCTFYFVLCSRAFDEILSYFNICTSKTIRIAPAAALTSSDYTYRLQAVHSRTLVRSSVGGAQRAQESVRRAPVRPDATRQSAVRRGGSCP